MTLKLTADPERVKHLLITARDELKARGWCQFSYGTNAGPKCSVGALNWAAWGHPEWPVLIEIDCRPVGDAIYVLERVFGVPAGFWNDSEGRTCDEVIAGFDAGISLVDAEIARRAEKAQRLADVCAEAAEVGA